MKTSSYSKHFLEFLNFVDFLLFEVIQKRKSLNSRLRFKKLEIIAPYYEGFDAFAFEIVIDSDDFRANHRTLKFRNLLIFAAVIVL